MQHLVKFHQFILKILSGNEVLTSIKEHQERTLTRNNRNICKNCAEICLFVVQVLSGNEILTSIKGHNFVINSWKSTCNNAKIDFADINV